jgi:hypothetical protein
MRLAFVLLDRPTLPSVASIEAAYERYRSGGAKLVDAGASDAEALALALGPDVEVNIGLVPAAIPGEEAEQAGHLSITAVAGDWQVPPHAAHLIVAVREPEGTSARAGVERFTRVLAAVTEAAGALAVYWGDAGATHPAAFFCDAAEEELPVVLWTGVSVAADGPERVSLLSVGIRPLFGIDDLMVTAPREQADDAIDALFSFLIYAIERGAALPAGETIGREAHERLRVSTPPSPIDAAVSIWRVDL